MDGWTEWVLTLEPERFNSAVVHLMASPRAAELMAQLHGTRLFDRGILVPATETICMGLDDRPKVHDTIQMRRFLDVCMIAIQNSVVRFPEGFTRVGNLILRFEKSPGPFDVVFREDDAFVHLVVPDCPDFKHVCIGKRGDLVIQPRRECVLTK